MKADGRCAVCGREVVVLMLAPGVPAVFEVAPPLYRVLAEQDVVYPTTGQGAYIRHRDVCTAKAR